MFNTRRPNTLAVQEHSATKADLRIGALAELISSDHIAPGAGAAGAVALALAAACEAKAVSVSLRHAPDDTCLSTALTRLEKLRDRPLQSADTDARFNRSKLQHVTETVTRVRVEASKFKSADIVYIGFVTACG